MTSYTTNLHYGTTWQHYVTKEINWSFIPDLFTIMLIFKYAYFKSNITPPTNKDSKINGLHFKTYMNLIKSTVGYIYCHITGQQWAIYAFWIKK